MTYDELLCIADELNLIVKEKPLRGYNGRIKGYRIAIRKDIPTLKEKACVLAEEIGHHLTSSGDILDQNITENRKQELKAKAVAYDIQVGLSGIIDAYEAGCSNSYTVAEFLGVTESFLKDAIAYYKSKYGLYKNIGEYVIYFEPVLGVMKLLNQGRDYLD